MSIQANRMEIIVNIMRTAFLTNDLIGNRQLYLFVILLLINSQIANAFVSSDYQADTTARFFYSSTFTPLIKSHK